MTDELLLWIILTSPMDDSYSIYLSTNTEGRMVCQYAWRPLPCLDHSLTIIYNLEFFSKRINSLFHYEIGHESSLQDSELQKRHDMLYIIWIMHRFIIITRRGLYTGLIRDSKRRKLLNENSVPRIIQSSSTVPLYSSLLFSSDTQKGS